MNKELETRFYSVELQTRAEGDDGIILGRPIVYSSRTDLGPFFEEIAENALDGTDLDDVRLCLNHDTDYVYARSRRNNANSTMRLMPNESGLDIEARLAIGKSAKAMDYFVAVDRGDITGMSFMFSVDDEEWRDLESDKPTRIIKKIGSVVEVSAVTFPAYSATTITARSKEALENARRELENVRQQRAAELENSEVERLKLKIKILGGKK